MMDQFLVGFAAVTLALRVTYETFDCPLFFYMGWIEDPRGEPNIMCRFCKDYDPHSCRTHTQAGEAIIPGGAWDPGLHHIGCFDILTFGPFLIVFIYAMINRKSWIRAPTLFMVGLQFGMIVEYLIADFAGDLPPPDPLLFLGCLAPEAGFWLLCLVRMAPSDPFGDDAKSKKA